MATDSAAAARHHEIAALLTRLAAMEARDDEYADGLRGRAAPGE